MFTIFVSISGPISWVHYRLLSQLKIPTYNRFPYEGYLIRQMRKYELEDSIKFLGPIDANAMKQQYLNSNVFVCSSEIENSPNSLCEAMMLGVPVVSADVGGVANLVRHNVDGYVYPSDEIYMLAHYIMNFFEWDDRCVDISKNARLHARETHNREKNARQLVAIYKLMLSA